jgi:hypothetical protein
MASYAMAIGSGISRPEPGGPADPGGQLLVISLSAREVLAIRIVAALADYERDP